MSKTFLKVSLSDIELLPQAKYDKNDIVCIVFLNGNCVDKLYFKYKDYQSNLPLANIIEKVQLIFQAKDTGELIGSISFASDTFTPFRGKSFAQWFTLFDSTEDDEFDGYIGEHDEEGPRALISFRIEGTPSSGVSINTVPSPMQYTGAEKEDFIFTNFSSNSNKSVQQGSKASSVNNTLFANDESETRDDVAVDKRTLNYNGTSSQDLLKNGKRPVQQTSVIDDSKKRRGQGESVGVGQTDDEIHVTNLDGKMTDLLSMLQNQEKVDVGSKKNDEVTGNVNGDLEENKGLLELEMKKTAMLEETLKSAEIQLSKHEKLYEELEIKSKAQFKQLLDKNKVLNEENYSLKQKISNFEIDTEKIKKDHASELENILQEHKKQADADQATIEKQATANETLERNNAELKIQLENMINALAQEKGLNQQLQKQLEENLTNNKEALFGLKDKMQSYFEQIQAVSEEKTTIEIRSANAELKIQALEAKNQALEAEYESSKKDLQKAVQEIQDYKNIANNLKESINEVTTRKDEEILAAKELSLNLEEQIRKLKSQNEFLNAEKKDLAEELANLKQMEYENRLNNLETALSNSEEARKNLQAQLQRSETRIQTFLQQQKERGLVSRAYEDTIQEMREKNKILTQQVEELISHDDQMKYENTELKLKLDAYGDINEQNARLKEKLNTMKDENYKLKDKITMLREQLFNASTELIRQTNTSLEQGNIIKQLTEQMKVLDNSLRIAFGDIKRMHFTLEAARRIEKPYDPYIPRYNDELDQKISEYCNKAELPLKFIRMKPGVYAFGSRRIKLELREGKIFVQAGGDSIPVEEFVRLYGQKELFKMKNVEGEADKATAGLISREQFNQGQVDSETRRETDASPQKIEVQDSSSFSPSKPSKKRSRKDRSSRQPRTPVEGEYIPDNAQRSPTKGEHVSQENEDAVRTELS